MANRMPDAAYEGADEASANRDLWTQVSTGYTDEHAFRAWAASEITWGIFNIPEDQPDVLGRLPALMSWNWDAAPRTSPPGSPGAGRGQSA
jgi:hypothetical protein